MSHWGRPRIHFSGTFVSDPPTLNNSGKNYALAAGGQPLIDDGLTGWNKNGSHEFSIRGGKVTAVVDALGQRLVVAGSDAAIDATLQSIATPVVAKIVDLDPDSQLVSEIYGLRVRIRASNGSGVAGTMTPVAFRDLAGPRADLPGSSGAVAWYHSTLENLEWTEPLAGVLAALRSVSPAKLALKFAVDRYRSPTVTVGNKPNRQGDIAGVIGPAGDLLATSFPAGRRLDPVEDPKNPSDVIAIGPAYCVLDAVARTLRLDLSGALPRDAAFATEILLEVGYLAVDQTFRAFGAVTVSLADYATTFWMVELADVPPEAAGRPLVIRNRVEGAAAVEVLREGEDGVRLEVEPRSLRLDPSQAAEVHVHAWRFGQPLDGLRVACRMLGRADGGATESGLEFSPLVTTGADGKAVARLRGGLPGEPRGAALDGGLYRLVFLPLGAAEGPTEPSCTVHVYDPFDLAPTWENIQPFLRVYARLYPFMAAFLSLDDRDQLIAAKDSLVGTQGVLDLPFTHPGLMPVTRDLSAGRLAALRAWLATV